MSQSDVEPLVPEAAAAAADAHPASAKMTRKEPSNNVDPHSQPRVFVKLFLHSVAMFTLPFIAYFFTKRVVQEEYNMTVEQGFIYGAIAAVIVVNAVIGSYVYQAFLEDDKNLGDIPYDKTAPQLVYKENK